MPQPSPSGMLPAQIWLCPVHSEEFWVPHDGRCPAEGCDQELRAYAPTPSKGDAMTVIRRSEPITDGEFDRWADAMGLPTPTRWAVRRGLMREYERGRAATTQGAVGRIKELEDALHDALGYAYAGDDDAVIDIAEKVLGPRRSGGQ